MVFIQSGLDCPGHGAVFGFNIKAISEAGDKDDQHQSERGGHLGIPGIALRVEDISQGQAYMAGDSLMDVALPCQAG